jgi:hypothetical protein
MVEFPLLLTKISETGPWMLFQVLQSSISERSSLLVALLRTTWVIESIFRIGECYHNADATSSVSHSSYFSYMCGILFRSNPFPVSHFHIPVTWLRTLIYNNQPIFRAPLKIYRSNDLTNIVFVVSDSLFPQDIWRKSNV